MVRRRDSGTPAKVVREFKGALRDGQFDTDEFEAGLHTGRALRMLALQRVHQEIGNLLGTDSNPRSRLRGGLLQECRASCDAVQRCSDMIEPEAHHFADDGRFPNSPLPLLVYRGALPPDPASMEQAFAAQGWSNAWRNGIFSYHHFHSTAHEVLGIARGEVTILLGGPFGREVSVQAEDVVVIPAGVAHRNVGQSDDLLVVGAYPGGSDYDTLRGDPAEYEAAKPAIAAVPTPKCDPVLGRDSGLCRLWAEQDDKAGVAIVSPDKT